MDFQARVNTIVKTDLLTERQIRWLEGVLDDTPLELEAETGGPIDDFSINTKGGRRVEVQAKRGLPTRPCLIHPHHAPRTRSCLR